MASLKLNLSRMLTICQVDRFYRFLNRNKLMTVMYHGITRGNYHPPVWTQLPAEIFEQQIRFLKCNYRILPLSELISYLSFDAKLPERSAFITFDDGLRNNYSVAYPILEKHSVPATVFLTTNYIDSDKILWFDELLFLIKSAAKENIWPEAVNISKYAQLTDSQIWELYFRTVSDMKRLPEQERQQQMDVWRNCVELDINPLLDDFGILSWEQIREMERSGVMDFGVHTANHQILSTLEQDEWSHEIKAPRVYLSEGLGKKVHSFCYPNGVPGLDYTEEHMQYLKDCGYSCSFSTEPVLFHPRKSSKYSIGRVPAGNDISSDSAVFRLATSGFRFPGK